MNEFDVIKRIRAAAEKRGVAPGLIRGIGDDGAVIGQTTGRDSVVTADLLVEDVDFRRGATPPSLLGHKALAVSLSDIAAMGARPLWALLSIGLPQDIWDSTFLDELYDGFFAIADRYDVKLIGGDLSRTPEKIVIDSMVIGECGSRRAVTRSGAKPGDHIFVTGYLGGSAAGLRLIERGARLGKRRSRDLDSDSLQQLLLRHLQPEPRVGWGLVLGQEDLATAMIDISDGLSSDLHHLCEESYAGAFIESQRIPINPLVVESCGRRALDPLLLALHGGEDFELLFTVSSGKVAQLPKKVDGVGVSYLGVIKEASEGVRIAEGSRVWDLEPGGWQHFKN